ncbi:MAG: hypothetical protein HYY09_08660 [Firmicutes bacterium]|nr:hypothetical protein [Bacillota bacterium]
MALLLALGLFLLEVNVGNAIGGVSLQAAFIEGDLPKDTADPAWTEARPVRIPLSAVGTLPTTARDVTARAVRNRDGVAIRMEWDDATRDQYTYGPESFSDAAAIQLTEYTGDLSVCMGQGDKVTHLWHWVAEREHGSRDPEKVFPNLHVDNYPMGGDPLFDNPAATVGNVRATGQNGSPVEHLVGGGPGSVTTHPVQNVNSGSTWGNDRWAVVFQRLHRDASADDVPLEEGKVLQVAFAVWDGAAQHRDGKKLATSWAPLELGPERGIPISPSIILLTLALFGVFVLMVAGFKQRPSGVPAAARD